MKQDDSVYAYVLQNIRYFLYTAKFDALSFDLWLLY